MLELAGAFGPEPARPVVRQELMRLLSEERIRGWTNQRVRGACEAGRSPGAGELDRQGAPGRLNQRIQLLATTLLGMDADRVGPA